jgi:hypothetical protein
MQFTRKEQVILKQINSCSYSMRVSRGLTVPQHEMLAAEGDRKMQNSISSS